MTGYLVDHLFLHILMRMVFEIEAFGNEDCHMDWVLCRYHRFHDVDSAVQLSYCRWGSSQIVEDPGSN